MDQSTYVMPQPLRTLSSASVSGTYALIGTLSLAARIVYIVNNSTQPITVSWDGVNDHDFVPSMTTREYSVGTQKGTSAPALDISSGTPFFAKGTAGTGTIALVSISAFTPTQTIPY